jgi:hypothetical protein
MALFTDGTISTMEDAAAYESSILDVTATEGIDLQTKLKLAQEELGVELEAFMAGRQIGAALENVVVTEPMKKWHVFQTLTLVYRDAYHRQLNDRHLGKSREYERLARWAWEALFQCGVGMTARPLKKAEKPELTAVDGGGSAAVYYVRVAWSDGKQEGCPSDLAVISVPAGSVAAVKAVSAPAGAMSWSVYAGYSATELARQNDSGLAAGDVWTAPAVGLRTTGAGPGTGQAPEYFVRAGRVLPRG